MVRELWFVFKDQLVDKHISPNLAAFSWLVTSSGLVSIQVLRALLETKRFELITDSLTFA